MFPFGLRGRLVVAGAVIGALVLWLHLWGRPWICSCGEFLFWQGALEGGRNSQAAADWYSLLHVNFGIGLFLLVDRTAPQWPTGAKALTALISSAVWEAIENLPVVVALFGTPPDAPAYLGDSILNALGDTAFVMIGFVLAARLPLWAVLVFAAVAEGAVFLAVDDGMIVGLLRLVGAEL
ncbi:DUF2585 family protein [Consotaella salsifontis]|uniref:DUF2585 family protein n=1 Tax=Consotaella salsifontis TaxID=1365950 RepID=UPI0013F5D0BE|nr:DUF2585 family protein [Consotaella salsifontis]